MSDDSGRRRGDDDETPVDPPTGEGDVVGADWILSQLDGPTGQMDAIRPASHDADEAQGAEGDDGSGKADRPVMAWWREKLSAAEAIVNPESRTAQDAEGGTAESSAEQPTGEPAMPEPARFEPRHEESSEHDEPSAPDEPSVDHEPALEDDFTFVPEPAWVPLPAAEPEPIFTPEPLIIDEPDDTDEDLDAHGERGDLDDQRLEDEPETGLIPSAEPPIFKPRSAREHIIEEESQSDFVAAVAPPSPELTDDEPFPDDAIPDDVIAPDVTAGEPSANEADEFAEFAENPTEDLDNFSWKLSPNDQLDPLVHTPGSSGPTPASGTEPTEKAADDATSVLPVVSGEPDTGSGTNAGTSNDTGTSNETGTSNDTDTGLPSRRQLRQEAEQQQQPAEPIIIASAAEPATVPGPRRKSAGQAAAPAAAATPGGSGEPPAEGPARPARPAAARAPRPVVIAAIALVAILVLGGLFFLGSQLPRLLAGPAPTETASPSPAPTETATPTPSAPAVPVGPAAPGERKWTALGGGECLEPYSTPWAETFTVVDCGAGHTAQMVFTAPVNTDPAAAYPGEEAILAQISLWCSAPGVLNAEVARDYDDLQVQGTYPVTEEQWAAGQRNYYCFVSRSSGEQLTGSLATAQN